MPVCIGCGLTTDVDGLLIVELKPGGGLTCDDAGLSIIPAGSPGSSLGAASTVTIGSNPCASDKENLLANGTGGVVALHTGSKAHIAGGDYSPNGDTHMVAGVDVGHPNRYTYSGSIVQIHNTCGDVISGTTEFAAGGVVVETAASSYVEVEVWINQAYDATPGWSRQQPSQVVVCDNRLGSGTVVWGIWLVDRAWQVLGPGATLFLGVQLNFFCSIGSGDIRRRSGLGWELTWHYSHWHNAGD